MVRDSKRFLDILIGDFYVIFSDEIPKSRFQ